MRAQDEPEKWELNGYVKFLHTAFLTEGLPIQTDNLIHNRINLAWYPSPSFTVVAQARNRLIWGDFVKLTPGYGTFIEDASQDLLDLGLVPFEGRGSIMHTTLDRLYVSFEKDAWTVRLGRQRINWGINSIWNPNDIFNAFSFIDFDYEERPGTDALRVQYSYSFASSVEFVLRPPGENSDHIAGLRWSFNQSGYDYQIIVAHTPQDFIIGGGWAGNLGNWGWKGEMTYFLTENELNSFAVSSAVDYTFPNQSYLSAGYLYNSNGTGSASINELFNFQLSAKNLYPYKHSMLIQYSYTFTPILNSSIALIYSPGENHPVFLNPLMTYSILENWDIDVVAQIIFNKEERYKSPVQAIFGRIKFSF
jgi:hypothetical protein